MTLEEFVTTLEDLIEELTSVIPTDTQDAERETVIFECRLRLGHLLDETRQTA
jgi:hypothetical protein